ncbi:transcriptional regulator [Psychrobacillus sp. L4]|uniref:transcriptional regulator n=1 Tax=Psychrobacillus sp. L4 TaxID=3236892 RepID=UPI0036F27DDD
MRILLEKYFSRGQIIELIYLSKSSEISKRRVKVIKIQGESFQAYCFKRNSKRTFLIDNVLACVPFIRKESMVIWWIILTK